MNASLEYQISKEYNGGKEDGQLQVEPIKLLSADDLFGMFDKPEDEGNFVLALSAAREEHAESILRMDITHPL